MKRILAIFLIVAVCVAVPDFAHVQIPADFSHCLSVQAAIAAPSYRINEWCGLRRYSRAEFYRMKARGDAPDTIGEGRMTRITPDADARGLKQQERKAKAKQSEAA